VADFPEQRINNIQPRTDHLILIQISDQRERASAGFAQRFSYCTTT
jgi:hypothetical protein